MEKEEKEENNEIKTTHNKLQRIISKTTKCLQNFDSQSNSAKTVSSIHSTGSADRIIFDCTHFVNIVSYGGILHWWRLVLIHKKNPKTTKIKVRFNISTVANTKEVNDHKIQRETQPWRHITLEEQDARVSANFTQKRQEKKCSYLQAKKKKESIFPIKLQIQPTFQDHNHQDKVLLYEVYNRRSRRQTQSLVEVSVTGCLN